MKGPEEFGNELEKKNKTPAIVVGVLLGLCMLVCAIPLSRALGASGTRNERYFREATISNAKQVALAVLMYQADYDDRFPPAFSTRADLRAFTMPYTKNEVYETLNPNGGELRPNPFLAGIESAVITDPSLTLMFDETMDWRDHTRIHAFTDGHAKFQAPGSGTILRVPSAPTP